MPKKPSTTTPRKNTGKKPLPKTKPIVSAGFPIVALGASAGGLEAFEGFFKHMPDNPGMAFVLVTHLDPNHVSLLPELIQKHCSMKVQQVTNMTVVQVDHVYVIPPKRNLEIVDGKLLLSAITKQRGTNLPIDSFLSSLAQAQGSNAVAIILSGTGSDGKEGIKAIKAETGLVMVQHEDSAKYDGMPRAAIATGVADYVLPVEKMPQQLLSYTQHALRASASKPMLVESKFPLALKKIYALLHAQTKHDFSMYKKNTICRRIERRMNVHQIEDIQDYVEYLQGSEREVQILFKELLIGITSFFRDAEAFHALKQTVLPALLKNKPQDYTIRVWVCGCSTGEEAYSLAILLQELMLENHAHFNVQVFATDIDEDAINTARAGLYSESIEADVSEERLKKYFIKEETGHYRIKKVIREMLVFAPQDIIKDPPFTKLDLLSCRNLMIYLGPELQQKLLPIFHYSLRPDGILFLGSSESTGRASDLFTVQEKKWKIFKKNSFEKRFNPVFEIPAASIKLNDREFDETPKSIREVEEISALQLVETILHQSDTAPCAIIDDSNNVVYIHGRTGLFLEPAEGKISFNILEMARAGLKAGLASAIRKVASHKQEVRIRDLEIEYDNGHLFVDVTVKPILHMSFMRGHMMVIFEEKMRPSRKKTADTKKMGTGKKTISAPELERELIATRESLQSTIEELETSNEELKSTNEELQSTNEELQSTNEEMETSKEELQSLNEESTTVNAELQSRIEELSESNDDMKNLLDSTNIATIFLDTGLCIRRFTPRVMELIPLSAQDTGRPLKHFSTSLSDADISLHAKEVLEDLTPREFDVHSIDNNNYTMKLRPYRTTNNVIDGVVITFDDISERKKAELALTESEARYRTLFELSSDSVVLIDIESAKFIEFNDNAHSRLGYTRNEFLDLKLTDIEKKETSTELIVHFDEILKKGSDTYFTQYRSKNGDIKDARVKAKVIDISGKNYLLSVWSSEEQQQ